METNKKRSCKTSAQQYNIYITFLEQNPQFAQNKMCASQPRYLEHKWEELRVLLNSCGNGAVHDVQGWKKTFRNWRSDVKGKARDILNHKRGTGGGKPLKKILSEIEERYLSLISTTVIDGAPQLQAIGGFSTSLKPITESEESSNILTVLTLQDVSETQQSLNSDFDIMTQIIGNCTADMGEIEGEVVESNVDETLPKSTPRRSLKRKRCTTDTQKEKKRYASDVATAYAAESRAQIEVFGNIAGSIKSVSVAICEVAKIQADLAEAHADLTKSHIESIHELSNSISKLADAHLKSADAKLKLAEAKLHKYNTNNK